MSSENILHARGSNRKIVTKRCCETVGRKKKVQQITARTECLTYKRKKEWLESDPDHGFIRLFAPVGSRSLIYPVSLRTTVQDICSILGFESLYLQIGGSKISNLTTADHPLKLQNEILSNIGYDTQAECMAVGDATHLTHIYCFYIGRPEQNTGTRASNEILVAWCNVRKGRLLQKWTKRRCTMYNGTIRIEHEVGDDEILLLSHYRADVADGSRGKYLRLVESSNVYCFQFDAIGEMNLWFSRLLQTQMAPSCDLSDHRLLLLPDELFSVNTSRQIVSLNLRRNSLQYRPNNQVRSPILGWVDDVGRLHALRSLNIADNLLNQFPNAVTKLSNLTELLLSGNRISCIPIQIGQLENLTVLNVSNNLLRALPEELSRCVMLTKLDLSFNCFEQLPYVLFTNKRIIHVEMAGNEINAEALHSISCIHSQKIDLRRNVLTRHIRLTSFICGALTELDIRDNENLFELDLSNLPSIQTIHCERLQLTNLQVNGTNLRHLFADENELSQVIIMPVPIQLVTFSISFNRFDSLPEWLTDLPYIETINAHHNFIRNLPYRIFMNVCNLKTLDVNNNKIERLPDAIENCSLENLSLHCNRIDVLPNDLLKSGHKLRNLNVSHNRLKSLPATNAVIDLNRLQTLRAASNLLDESVINTVVSCRRLRYLDLSYNQLKFFDDSCLSHLTALEEVNLSANHLTSISVAFGHLPNLQVLRIHSNAVTVIPDLSQSPQLTLLDISNNEFGSLDTNLCMAKSLKHLDLTCNYMLQVDTTSIKSRRNGRSVSVIDVGSECNYESYHFGFSETTGQRNKLCIRQIRPRPKMCSVFGIVDGGNNGQIAALVTDKLYDYFQKQASVNECSLKMALIYAHEHLGQIGERLGASAMLLKIEQQRLLYATVGCVRAVLCRSGNALQFPSRPITITVEDYLQIRAGNATLNQDNLIDGICSSTSSLGLSFLYPAVLPKPHEDIVRFTGTDEFIIIGSRALWEYVSPQRAVDSVRAIYNPQIAAKKLQDMVQSFEYAGNISIIVVRLKKARDDDRSGASHQITEIKNTSYPRNDVNLLRNIEERLELISEAIIRLDDDSNNNRTLSAGFDIWDKEQLRTFESMSINDNDRGFHRSCSSVVSSKMSKQTTSGALSPIGAPPDPHTDSESAEKFSIRKRIDMYDQLGALNMAAENKKHFQNTRPVFDEQHHFLTSSQKTTKLYNM